MEISSKIKQTGVTNITEHPNDTSHMMFFLGPHLPSLSPMADTGASIDAQLPGVIRLLHEFKKHVETNSKIEQLFFVNNILDILREFKYTKKDESPVDVEFLLETIEKIENRDDDILMYFFKNEAKEIQKFKAYETIFKGKEAFSSEIKQFIKKVFSETQMNTQYLNPLNDFIKHYRPLCIFSTNYDVCIEKFCQDNNKDLVDGFNPRWNPEREYNRSDVDVRLYKLHGSITWYRSEQGDYTRSDIVIENERATSIAGQQMVPLILYPGRKLEYVEPVIYLLVELEKQLRNVKYVFAIGYSFKDDHLVKLFQYAARKNPDLIVFLISPSA